MGVIMTKKKVYLLIHAKETKQSGIQEFVIGFFLPWKEQLRKKRNGRMS